MDRDKRWQRVQKCYDALVNGEGIKAGDAIKAIEDSYQKEVFDEFVEPTVLTSGNEPVAKIEENDSVIFFNFRPDRAREITRALTDKEFNAFETKKLDLFYVCFTNYDETIKNVQIAFKKEELKNTFGEIVSNNALTEEKKNNTKVRTEY